LENKKTYNASDFERYHSGKMTPSEMHQLEKAALEDPFLSEALDGYVYTKTPVDDMSELLARVSARAGSKKRSLPIYIKYAAAVVILIGLATLFLKINERSGKDKQESVLAKIEQDTVIANTPSPVLNEGMASNRDTLFTGSQTSAENIVTEKIAAPSVPVTDASVSPVQEEQKLSNVRSDLNLLKDDYKAEEKEKTSSSFSGRITDTAGNPVAFASVNVPGAGGIQSDAEGRFRLPVNSNDSILRSTISAIGYRAVTEDLKKNETALIRLQPSDKISTEVVTTSPIAGTSLSKSNAASSSRVNAEAVSKASPDSMSVSPRQGWTNYNKYVDDKLKTVYNNAIPGNTTGTVVLRFDILKNGRPANISVVKSVNKEADAAAVKILEQGPGWNYKKGSQKASINIRIN